MTTTRDIIEEHWRASNMRDWQGLARVLSESVLYEVPQTRERVRGRDAYVEYFRTWPGNWQVEIRRLVADENGGVTEINFVSDGEEMTGISFFEISHGLIHTIVDHWPSPYDPPPRMTPLVERY